MVAITRSGEECTGRKRKANRIEEVKKQVARID
jgi:ribosomal protein L29